MTCQDPDRTRRQKTHEQGRPPALPPPPPGTDTDALGSRPLDSAGLTPVPRPAGAECSAAASPGLVTGGPRPPQAPSAGAQPLAIHLSALRLVPSLWGTLTSGPPLLKSCVLGEAFPAPPSGPLSPVPSISMAPVTTRLCDSPSARSGNRYPAALPGRLPASLADAPLCLVHAGREGRSANIHGAREICRALTQVSFWVNKGVYLHV